MPDRPYQNCGGHFFKHEEHTFNTHPYMYLCQMTIMEKKSNKKTLLPFLDLLWNDKQFF